MEKMKMKAVLALALTAAVLAGCASAPKEVKAETVKATQQIEVLSHKNLAMGGDTMPPWVVTWREENSMRSVMALPQYKGFYVFIGESTASTQTMATEWANSFDARQQVSTYMNSAVSTTLQATRRASQIGAGSSNAEESSQAAAGAVDDDIRNALSAVSISQVSGLQKDGDYWLLTRTHNSDGSTSDEYRAFVLYLIDEKSLNNQALAMLKDIEKNNSALVGLVTAAQARISDSGVEWGAKRPE
jgi:opacity protein-like surface antigen